jgi:RluA family pseudouridine synthase
LVNNNDHIVHETTREETPVSDEAPYIIKETDNWIIVNKPSSTPVHCCGNFKKNSL